MRKTYFLFAFFIFSILFISSCSSDDALTPNSSFTGSQQNNGNGNNESSNQALNPDTDFYFTGDLGGNNLSFISGQNGYSVDRAYIESGGVNGTTNIVTYASLDGENDIFNGTDELPALGIELVVVLPTPPTSGESYRAKLDVGMKDFGNAVTGSGPVEGAVVRWFDNDGVEWTTNKGSGDQTESTFEITEFTPTQEFGDEIMIIRASFDCTLYDDNGNEITIEGGRYRSSFLAN